MSGWEGLFKIGDLGGNKSKYATFGENLMFVSNTVILILTYPNSAMAEAKTQLLWLKTIIFCRNRGIPKTQLGFGLDQQFFAGYLYNLIRNKH